MYERIVVGTDGSATADRAVEHAFGLARVSGAVLHVLTAYRPLSTRDVLDRQRGLPPGAREEIDQAHEARRLLAEVERRATGLGLSTELYARIGDAGELLVELAGEVGAELIVVGNKGMTGLRRVLGSVPNHVAHHSPCSVMIVSTTD